MKTATISTLKAKLSEHITWVKQGEEVVVTERGRPVARLVPVPKQASDDARQVRLASQGLLRLGKPGLSDLLANIRPVQVSDRAVLDALRADREEGG
ncbi:MAG: type II toxin-antitoxin system prevent-host-death family antitoxin [Candidatus Latescibacterota bacterium]|jgi:prevent-host-death family protein